MEEVIRFALIGLGLGAMYSLASQGLVLIYRGSGVLNFAHGAVGMVGAYAYYELRNNVGLPFLVSALLGVAVSALIGALTQILIMRQLRRASPLARVVSTLGLLLTLQSLAVLRYGGRATFVAPELPQGTIHIYGTIELPEDRLIMLIVAAVLTAALWAIYRYTMFGLATSAVAENEVAAATLGWSAERIAVANWSIGSALAGVAAILVSPIVTLQVSVMTNLVLAALAAALVAGFRSFPIAFFAGVALGIAQTVVGRYTADTPGLALSVPFAVIVLMLVLRGQTLPLRDFLLQRLPVIGTGRISWPGLGLAVLAGALLILFTTDVWVIAIIVTLAFALVLLSIVVVTGYAGQLSLAQFALAGFGAWVAGRATVSWHVPFVLAFVLGVLAAIPLGMLFALPAVRTRGISLAVVTLGLGTALEYMVFDSGPLTGGFSGTNVGNPSLFGWDIDAISHPERYAFVTLGVLVVFTLCVSNIRRGRSGRRLIAVRTNERAAAALGISVSAAKLYAFGVAGAMAAAGGIMLAFINQQVNYGTVFTNFTSISATGWAVIGGIGFLLGPIIGGTLAPGSVGAQLLDLIPGGFSKYLLLISGVLLILFVLQNQDGSAREFAVMGRMLKERRSARRSAAQGSSDPALATSGSSAQAAEPAEAAEPLRVRPRALTLNGMTVRYGATTAVDNVSFDVAPGEVVGLIGPNGAGKTSLIDGVTGFAAIASGDVGFDSQSAQRMSAAARARVGISRSFQSLELFDDSTVRDNLQTAADPHDLASYLRDLVVPRNPGLTPAAQAAVREFGLAGDLDRAAKDLSYGKRRLLAIARAVAAEPSILLLDEPAAGLGDTETTELAHLVRRLASDWGIAVLLVEHDMNLVMSICDKVVVIDFGHKIAEGTPDQVRSDPAVLQAYLGVTEDELDEVEQASTPAQIARAEVAAAGGQQ